MEGVTSWSLCSYDSLLTIILTQGQKSDNDSKNQLNLNGERSVKEDAGALKGCTEVCLVHIFLLEII